MEKFIPYEKLSKQKKRDLNKDRRRTWGAINPITRRTENPKAYNRKKSQKWSDDSAFGIFAFSLLNEISSERGNFSSFKPY